MVWRINTSCESVYIWSTLFETEDYYDKVLINQKMYSGEASINEILPSSFEVYFTSDESVTDNGFVLEWNCYRSAQKALTGLIRLIILFLFICYLVKWRHRNVSPF